jgi:hypothetical protein
MTHRTTVVANEEDLAVLEHEARSRGISLGRMLGEAVAREAEELRQERRPRLATFRTEVSIADAAAKEDPGAGDFRSRWA